MSASATLHKFMVDSQIAARGIRNAAVLEAMREVPRECFVPGSLGEFAYEDTPLPIELTGSYQQERWNRPGVTPYALASPILVDADRNGRWRRQR